MSGSTTVCEVLHHNAERHGDRPAHAWRDGERWHTLSYRDCYEQVLEVACGLINLADVKIGDHVAIMAANRTEHVVAALGVMFTGGAPSTFYSTLAPDQIRYVADNCSARVAILENDDYLQRWLAIRDRLPALEHIVLMEGAEAHQDVEGLLSWEQLRARGRDSRHRDRWRQVRPADPATLIYTSGTTGPPKGVVLTHENCAWEARAICDHVGLTHGITTVSYLPLAHIAEQMITLFIPLMVQAHVHFCPDVKQALDFVRKARPAAFFGVPRVWEKMRAALTTKLEAAAGLRGALARAALDAGTEVVRLEQKGQPVPLLLRLKAALLDRLILARIRQAIGLDRCRFAASAAAPLPVDVAEFFAALGLPLIEVWGMTEVAGVGTAPDPRRIKIGWVGPALPGVEARVGDDGELLVRGPNCTPGYLNLPEQTAELIDEDGWLHSGDIAEQDGEGYFRIVDRKKELIITAGGKNISPVLVESLLKEHPLVGQALVFGDRKPYVVALVVLDGEVAPTWAEQQGIESRDVAGLARHPRVRQEVERAVERANSRLARVEQIKRFEVLPAEWTAESEELTPTLKLKRRVIHDKYRERIESLYATERPTG